MATLYHVPTSRSLRVLWTLEEIGATVEVKSLGVRPRLQEPEYLAINPAGTLPALIDGDRAIYESLAICEYSRPGTVPTWSWAPDEPERPEFVQWLLYGEATLQTLLSAMARVGRAGDADRHRCRAGRCSPLALDAGKATRAAAGGS
jgi:glutathione S-transferase